MQLTEAEIKQVLVTLTEQELISLLKVLQFTIRDLAWEYSTRTGFLESEAQELIEKLKSFKPSGSGTLIGDLANKELLIIRQNLLEVIGGIRIEDHLLTFGISGAGLENWFAIIDQYGEEHGFWKKDPGMPNIYGL